MGSKLDAVRKKRMQVSLDDADARVIKFIGSRSDDLAKLKDLFTRLNDADFINEKELSQLTVDATMQGLAGNPAIDAELANKLFNLRRDYLEYSLHRNPSCREHLVAGSDQTISAACEQTYSRLLHEIFEG